MVLLRTRCQCDIEEDNEMLSRYWHQDKDAWQNIFDCQCGACTEHRRADTPTSTECAQDTTTSTTESLVQASDTIPWDITNIQITTIPHHGRSQELMENDENDYPYSEVDNIDWNDLENSLFRGVKTETKPKE